MSEKPHSKMFDFGNGRLITWNPIRMKRCPNECYNHIDKESGKTVTGCWANKMRETKLKTTYQNPSLPFLQYLSSKELERWTEGYEGVVFMGSMCDPFIYEVPTSYLQQAMNRIRENPKTTFLLMTKTPTRYLELLKHDPDFFPANILFGITIETNRDYPEYGRGEPQTKRIAAAIILSNLDFPVFLSIEPIVNFDPSAFVKVIKEIQPWGVAIGYDNYNNNLSEPSLEKTLKLIEMIKEFKVYRKVMREAHGN